MAPYSANPEKNSTPRKRPTGRRASSRMSASGWRAARTGRRRASGDADRQRDDRIRWPNPAAVPAFDRPRIARAMPGARSANPRTSSFGLTAAAVSRGRYLRGQNQPGDAERHVHPEHEPPAQVGQDGAADERSEDRPEQGGQRDQGDGPAERLAPGRLHDQRRQDREAAGRRRPPGRPARRSASRRSRPGSSRSTRPGRRPARTSTAACPRTAAAPRWTAAPPCPRASR